MTAPNSQLCHCLAALFSALATCIFTYLAIWGRR